MYNKKTRTENATLNTKWALICQSIILIMGVITRKVFLDFFGAELLGVNSLFSDVLILFSFADLGFGTAIMFSMYRPIAEGNTKKIESLLYFYKSIYRGVIIILSVISLCFIPLLAHIKTSIDFDDLVLYFLFFQVSNILEYVWAYRESYVIACQRERELTKWNLVYYIFKNLVQILVIVLMKDFVAYLTVGLVSVILKKIVINKYILTKYPITKLINPTNLEKQEKKIIFKKSTSLMITKIGNLIINQTDSVIVSYLLNVVIWGYASNYLLIKKAIFTISDKIYSSILPGMGNLVVNSDNEHKTSVFLKYDFYNAWMNTFFFVAFVCLSNPFISFFFGESAVLDTSFVFVFFFASFIDGLRSPVSIMREASGTFEKDKWYTIIAAFVNIFVSVPLALKCGLVGVYIGTICSMLVLHISRAFVLFHDNKMCITTLRYLSTIFQNVLVGLLLAGITLIPVEMVDRISNNIYIQFLMKCLIVIVVPNLLWCILFQNKIYLKEVIYKILWKDTSCE